MRSSVIGLGALAALLIGSPALAADDLVTRFARLSCAVVRLDFDGGSGTGFFSDNSGHILTAAHVAYERTWTARDGKPEIALAPHQNIRAVLASGKIVQVSIGPPSPEDKMLAGVDVAQMSTGQRPPCQIALGNAKSAVVGQHLIAIGFPAGNPTGVLYDGFISAIHTHLPIPIGNADGQPVIANYEVLRIQMPITPGASGSPVINDQDEVIGIVSEVPVVLTSDIQQIIQAFAGGQSSGIRLSGFDTTKILAQLAFLVVEFESPGSGFAVPVFSQRPNH